MNKKYSPRLPDGRVRVSRKFCLNEDSLAQLKELSELNGFTMPHLLEILIQEEYESYKRNTKVREALSL